MATDTRPNCVLLISDENYTDRMLKTVNDLRVQNYSGIICIVCVNFQFHADILQFYRLTVVNLPKIDTSIYLSSITQFPFKNGTGNEYKKINQLQKFNIFHSYWKENYKFILYIDCGARIYNNIDIFWKYAQPNALLAMNDAYPHRPEDAIKNHLSVQFDQGSRPELYKKLAENYDLTKPYFLNAVFLFDTNIIESDTRQTLMNLANEYPLGRSNDMAFICLYYTLIKPCWHEFPTTRCPENGKILFDWAQRNGNSLFDYVILKYPYSPNI